MDGFIAVLIVVVGVLSFLSGMEYGKELEKAVVGAALAEYGKLSAEAVGLIQRFLSRLERGYTEAYDDAVAEYERIKKAL
jgi:hypothetical protein